MDSPRTATTPTPATTTTVTYVIDTAGNLRSVTGGEHSVSYVYGDGNWADKLTGITVDNVSRTISYADAGNPSNWYNGTHEFTNLTWTQGRRLSNITEGSDTYSYEYDMSGVRTVKIADGKKHEYVTQNGRVVRETVYAYDSGSGEYSTFQYALDFTYDESGHPLTMRKYNNADMQTNYITMHYVCNAQGDVVKLIYGGTVYAEYAYDAWGNVLTAVENGNYDYAALNPLRYRGYYYDTETGFYYLQSRYYDPIVKRFLNADSYGSTGQGFLGFNMFAYCNNDPVANEDPTGKYIGHQPIMVCDGRYGIEDTDTKPTYITSQNDPSISSMQLGISTIGHSGCGVVAIYNALISMGDYMSISDIIDYFNADFLTRTLAGGLAGIPPYAVANFFIDHGYRVVSFSTEDDLDYMDCISTASDANILWYLYKPSNGLPVAGHFMAYTWDGVKGTHAFTGYNYNRSNGVFHFSRPSQTGLSGRKFYAIVIAIFKEDD